MCVILVVGIYLLMQYANLRSDLSSDAICNGRFQEVREYDGYDVEGELEEDYESCEEYEEEEEAGGSTGRKAPYPTQEELEYLELRQRLKESIRRKNMKENASTLSNAKEKQKKFSKDNYGSALSLVLRNQLLLKG